MGPLKTVKKMTEDPYDIIKVSFKVYCLHSKSIKISHEATFKYQYQRSNPLSSFYVSIFK